MAIFLSMKLKLSSSVLLCYTITQTLCLYRNEMQCIGIFSLCLSVNLSICIWLTLNRLVSMVHIDVKATSISISTCRITVTELVQLITWVYIMPLIINSLRGRHTHIHSYRHPYQNNFKETSTDQCSAGLSYIAFQFLFTAFTTNVYSYMLCIN